MELGLAIYPGYYDHHGVDIKDWSRFIHAKQAARDIVTWHEAHFKFILPHSRTEHLVYPRLLLSMSVTLIRYIEKQNGWRAEQCEEEEDGEEEQVDTSAPIEATLYEVLEVLEDNPDVKLIFDRRKYISSSFDYSYLHHGLDLSVVKDPGYDPPAINEKPNMLWERWELIQGATSNNTWPVPRQSLDQFLCRDG
jgi:hypothetical protein